MQRISESLLASIAVYALGYVALEHALPYVLGVCGVSCPYGHFGDIALAWQAIAFLVIAVGLGGLWSRALTWTRPHDLLARIVGSNRTTGESVWSEVFRRTRGKWVLVHLKDGTRYQGWQKYCSDEPGTYEIFLADATRKSRDQEEIRVEGPGVFISALNAESLELWDSVETRTDTPEARKSIRMIALRRGRIVAVSACLFAAGCALGWFLGRS